MAAYKVPRVVEFVERLPKSATGKVQWRLLQETENKKNTGLNTKWKQGTCSTGPKQLPRHLTVPATSLYANLEISSPALSRKDGDRFLRCAAFLPRH